MRTAKRLVLLISALASIPAFSDSPEKSMKFMDEPISSDEVKIVDSAFRASEEPNMKLRKKYPDGAYGYELDSTVRKIIYSQNPEIQKKFELKNAFCHADLVVLAKAMASRSFMTSSKSMVFTKYRLDILDTIGQKAGATRPNEQIHVVAIGGEVEQDNEKFRVTNLNSAPYQAGETYVLALREIGRSGLYSRNGAGAQVYNSRVFPERGRTSGISAGDNYTDTVQRIRDLYLSNCE